MTEARKRSAAERRRPYYELHRDDGLMVAPTDLGNRTSKFTRKKSLAAWFLTQGQAAEYRRQLDDRERWTIKEVYADGRFSHLQPWEKPRP